MLSVRSQCMGDHTAVEITQDRFLGAPGVKASAPQTWTIPVCFKAAPDAPAACEVISQKTQTIKIPGCASEVVVNAGSRGYFYTEYTPETVRALGRKARDTLKIPGSVRYSRWWKKSSHVQRNVNSAVVTSAGAASGTMIRAKIPTFPHPSIVAASSSSFGRLRMNCTSRNTKNASIARNFGTMIGRNVPTHPKELNRIYCGTIVT